MITHPFNSYVPVVVCMFCFGLPSYGQSTEVHDDQPAAQTTTATAQVNSKEDYRRYALRFEGNLIRGKQLFARTELTMCSKCHTIDGKGGMAGPDLFAVGDKFGRREIIDAVLAPSEKIADGYTTAVITTRSGDVYHGSIKQVTDAWIELIGADAEPVRIPTMDIQSQDTSAVSLMPDGVEAGLTLQAFTDLIEYLVTLKQPESKAMIEHGMPNVIQKLARPIAVNAFIAEDMSFTNPVWIGLVPGESNVFLVAEHETGKIWRLEKGPRRDTKTVFADVQPYMKATRGLLGLAFHPKFTENQRYFYAKQISEDGQFVTIIYEAKATPDLRRDSGKPMRTLLRLDEATNVHYGGGLGFGPDGYFYIGMGDSGPQEDPQGHGQNLNLLRGKMLRIDVDHDDNNRPYAIPPDNPFVGHPQVRPEIWAYGFREPWRFSFDPLTNDLWVGDVGQDRYEEVAIVRRGENHGWNVYEGFEPFSNTYRRDGDTHIPPVFAYARKYGLSVTGGYVYRADPTSSFYGVYIFADYESKRIWGLTQENRVLKKIRQIGTAPQRIASFGQDEAGELYIVGYEGMIYKIDFDQAVFE